MLDLKEVHWKLVTRLGKEYCPGESRVLQDAKIAVQMIFIGLYDYSSILIGQCRVDGYQETLKLLCTHENTAILWREIVRLIVQTIWAIKTKCYL